MRGETSDMPITKFSDISLDREDVEKFLVETMTTDLGLVENPEEAQFCLYPTANVFGESTACVVNANNVAIHGSHQCLTASSIIAEDQTRRFLEDENKVFQKFYPHMEHLVDVVHFYRPLSG
jgi:hypothetical protein